MYRCTSKAKAKLKMYLGYARENGAPVWLTALKLKKLGLSGQYSIKTWMGN